MKAVSDTMELKDELENDLALAMLIEGRHSGKIGSEQARELIDKIKHALGPANIEPSTEKPDQNLNQEFPLR